jgi:hypothetical protein
MVLCRFEDFKAMVLKALELGGSGGKGSCADFRPFPKELPPIKREL